MSTRRNAMYNVAYRVFSVLLPLVTAPYLSRVAGQEGVGLYSYAWSISEIFVIIGTLGLTDYGVRAIARVRDDQAELNRTFSEVFRMQLLVAGVTLLGWLGYVAFVAGAEQQIALHLTLMSASCLINLDWVLMGLDQFKPIALRNTLVKLAAAGAVFLFVKGPGDLWIYGLVWSLATVLGCLLCWPGVKKRVRLVNVTWGAAMKHFGPCAVLLLSVLAVRVYRTMDKVMVGALAGMAQNGLYENAEKIVYCLSGFISAIGTVLMPKAAHLLAQGKEEKIRGRMASSMDVILCMTGAMAFGLAAVAGDFAPLFYGEDFAYSGLLMIPLGFTLMMIGFANVVRTQWILPHGRDGYVVRCVTTGAVVNVILNVLLIPRMGAMGAVIGTLAAEMSVPTVQFLLLRKELPYGLYVKKLLTYVAAGVAMMLSVRLIAPMLPESWLGLMVQVALGAAVYGAACLVLWKLTGNRSMLNLIKRRA